MNDDLLFENVCLPIHKIITENECNISDIKSIKEFLDGVIAAKEIKRLTEK